MLAVRLLHVLAVSLAVGGAALTWWLARQSGIGESPVESEAAISVAAAYERGFWAAAGLLVMTGVGNLGSLAPAVPPVGTEWGTVFAAKLLLVLGLLALSLVRTLVVVRYRRTELPSASGPGTSRADGVSAATRTLRFGYGATAASLALLVALAEVLAHG